MSALWIGTAQEAHLRAVGGNRRQGKVFVFG